MRDLMPIEVQDGVIWALSYKLRPPSGPAVWRV